MIRKAAKFVVLASVAVIVPGGSLILLREPKVRAAIGKTVSFVKKIFFKEES